MKYIFITLFIAYMLIPLWIGKISRLQLHVTIKKIFIITLVGISISYTVYVLFITETSLSMLTNIASFIVYIIYIIVVLLSAYIHWPRLVENGLNK